MTAAAEGTETAEDSGAEAPETVAEASAPAEAAPSASTEIDLSYAEETQPVPVAEEAPKTAETVTDTDAWASLPDLPSTAKSPSDLVGTWKGDEDEDLSLTATNPGATICRFEITDKVTGEAWTLTGGFDASTGRVTYRNGILTEEGKTVYSDGIGYLVLDEKGTLVWVDGMDGVTETFVK